MDDSLVFERYYNLALRYLSYRPRSEKEVLDYLRKKVKNQKSKGKIESQNEKTIDDSLIDKIITKLKEYKFVDDLEFAKFWLDQRTKINPKSWRVIKFELKQKGISEEIIDLLVKKETVSLDLDSARKLVDKKLRSFRSISKDEAYRKLLQFLGRRGFDFDTSRKVVKERLQY